MKKGKLIGIVVLVTCLMTGCVDHMPEMTQEQSDLIAEYAADLLLKYSPNYEYRLAEEGMLAEAVTEAVTEEETTEETTVPETQQEEKESIHVEVDVEVTQESEETQETQTQEVEIAEASETDLAELLDLDGFELSYDSYEVCDSYPNTPGSTGFAVSAEEDGALLVVHFTVENTGEETVTCDLFDVDAEISMSVNGAGNQKLMNTLLTNDITTFIEEMDASEKQDIVAILEIDAEEEVETLTMKISGKNGKETVKLK